MATTHFKVVDASNLVDSEWPANFVEHYVKLSLVLAVREGSVQLEIRHTQDGVVHISEWTHDKTCIMDKTPFDASTGKLVRSAPDTNVRKVVAEMAGINPEVDQEGWFELRLRDASVNVRVTIVAVPDGDTITFLFNAGESARERATSILAEWAEHPQRGCWAETVNPFHLKASERSEKVVRRCVAIAAALLIILFGYILIVLCT